MSTLSASSLAAANASGIKNVVFSPSPQAVPRKILIIGTGDPATESANDLTQAIEITSAEDLGSKTGFGFMLHRLAQKAYLGSGSVETWYIQQAESGTAVQAAGEIDFTGSSATESGTLAVYIANDRVPVAITSGDAPTAIGDALVAAITADSSLPVTASNAVGVVTITAKSGGTYGNFISIETNLQVDDALPAGVVASITDMASGANDPDLADALDLLGTGDGANEAFFTDVIASGYGHITAQLDALSAYVGEGNDFVGLYDKMVHKPFYALCGDVVAGSAGLTAIKAVGNARKSDRSNGVISVPGSASHPAEIAAQVVGINAATFTIRPEETPCNKRLVGVHPGVKSDRWTSDYDNRDAAVKAGISPTFVKNGEVYLQNVCTFYHPDSVPTTSNGYRSVRNIALIQNILYNQWLAFEQESWQGVTFVADVAKVGSASSQAKVRDTDAVISTLVGLAKGYESKAWIYTADYTIEQLNVAGAVAIREGGDGFDATTKVILSGEGLIFDNKTEIDTSIAVLA